MKRSISWIGRVALVVGAVSATSCLPFKYKSASSPQGTSATPTSSPSSTPAPTPTPTPTPSPSPTPPPGAVALRLQRNFDGGTTISFGLPLPPGALSDLARLRVQKNGSSQPIAGAKVKTLLNFYNAAGAVTGIRSVLIQIPSSAMVTNPFDIDVFLNRTDGAALPQDTAPVSAELSPSSEVISVADRTISKTTIGGQDTYALVTGPVSPRTLFTGTEPRVMVIYPDGYLAGTGILGGQLTRTQVQGIPRLRGLSYLSDYLGKYSQGAIYDEGYPINPAGVVDPIVNFEGWLYDRCTTFLTSAAHNGDLRFYRHALRSCSYYSGKINAFGLFTGKPPESANDPKSYDPKYSHLRGIFAYYAMTGDETALNAGVNMANMWQTDAIFVLPYSRGAMRGIDRIWTERLLGTSMEGLFYGHLLTGDPKYLTTFKSMFETAYRHITTQDQATLNAITLSPGLVPQNCFIHNARQATEGDVEDPWCSGWMTELIIDSFLGYQQLTGDNRVDEVFVRLTRFLRDVATQYMTSDVFNDYFLRPAVCFNPAETENPRVLVPLYGAGLLASGARDNQGQYDDYQHCADATALTAVALVALQRQGKFNGPGVGPFATEGASFTAMHHEFSLCAANAFRYHARTGRDPRTWTSGALAAGYSNGVASAQTTWINNNKIGFASHESAPQRKLSWWFNTSMLQFSVLSSTVLDFATLKGGNVQPTSCP